MPEPKPSDQYTVDRGEDYAALDAMAVHLEAIELHYLEIVRLKEMLEERWQELCDQHQEDAAKAIEKLREATED